MPLYILTIVIQVAFVLHIVKTKRNTTWIWIVIILPLAGAIAYFIIEILPDLIQSRSGRSAKRTIGKIINPNKDLNNAASNYSIVDTVENSITLAEEFIDKEMYLEAKALYEKCLKGIHEGDPDILFGVARAEFGLTHYKKTKSILDEVIKNNPDYKNQKAHLLYARALEELNETDLALEEYAVLDNYYLGAEATYRYARLLKKSGQDEKSNACFEKIIAASKISGKHYNSLNKEWLSKSKSEFQND